MFWRNCLHYLSKRIFSGDSLHLSKTSDYQGEKNRAGKCNEFNFSLQPTIYNIPDWSGLVQGGGG